MNKDTIVGVIGAGTMGSGIAQLAAQAGHRTFLFDAKEGAVERALASLKATFDKLVEKQKLTATDAQAIHARIVPAAGLQDLAPCGLVIEAIVEDVGIKRKLFGELEGVLQPDAVLGTNTSSLSVTAIAAGCTRPEQVIGLHFFNPAPLMPLVEVAPGLRTTPALVDSARALMVSWGKSPVVCKDTPGFIVNRVARPFYGEAIRIYEEGIADMRTIDQAMRNIGFRMGPFELMDLIGNDVNLTVTKTVWQSFFFDPRYKPSFTQQRQVDAGWLGRKSGQGYYNYAPGQPEAPAVSVSEALQRTIADRILVMLINEAMDALHLGIASAEDIDLAMTKGVNYPKGLLAWAAEKGHAWCLHELESLRAEYCEDRYRPSVLLRCKAATATT